ncbi:hypothetical protein ACWGID_29355 [Kribbella sp. NPDC054772]
MDATVVALIGAGIGAAGAVAGQVVAAVFTGRRESKKLEWEKQQAIERRQSEQKARFLDTKRVAYARYIQLCVRRHDELFKAWLNDGKPEERLKDLDDAWWDAVSEVMSEIALLSPPLEDVVRKSYRYIVDWEVALHEDGAEGQHHLISRAGDALAAARKSLSRDLGVSDPAELAKPETGSSR